MADNPRIEELRRRVLADPASIAFAALAEEYRRMGRYDEAVETCRAGLLRHPAYLSARVTLGRALIETGDYNAAREELGTVLHSAPENLAAIRGLAQIDERLGHSTAMDPHLADIMESHHAEQIRVAALAPPPPPDPVIVVTLEPEPAASLAPQPLIDMAPAAEDVDEPVVEPPPTGEPQASEDVFARFAQAATPPSAPEYSLDLSTAFDQHPATPPVSPVTSQRAPLGRSFESEVELPPPALLEPGLHQVAQREAESEVILDEPLEALGLEAVGGPDPAVLATLARLERFLSAIESLRA